MSATETPPQAAWVLAHSLYACALVQLNPAGGDGAATVLLANERFLALVGSASQLPMAAHALLHFDPMAPAWLGALDAAVLLGQHGHCEAAAYRQSSRGDGATESFLAGLHLVPMSAEAGGADTLALLSVTDESGARQTTQELAQERQRTATVLAELEEGVLVVDSAMEVAQLNASAAAMLGLDAREAVGRHANDALHFVDTASGGHFNNPMVTAVLVGIDAGWTEGVALVRPDGSQQPVRFCTKVIRDDEGMPVEAVLILRNANQEGVVLASLNHQAGHDMLTGLVLRQVFDDRLAQALALSERHGRRSAVVLVHLQALDEARLHWGHAATDERLKRMAGQLLDLFRRSDTLCRFDENHFALILTHLDDVVSAELLLRKLSRVDQEAPLTLRAALSFYPQHAETAPALLAHCAAQLAGAPAPG